MAECNTCGGYLSIEDKIRLSIKCDANGNVVWQGALLNPFEDEYNLILAAMTTEPSDDDKINQNKLVKDLKGAGIWAKGEVFDMFSIHSDQLINFINPGTFTPVKNGNPGFIKYGGYSPGFLNNINIKYVPFASTKITKDNTIAIIALGSNLQSADDDFGGFDATSRLSVRGRHTDNKAYFRINSTNLYSIENTDSIKYYAVRRISAGSFDIFVNLTKQTIELSSSALPNIELYAGGSNENSTIKYANKIVRFVWIGEALTDQEYTDFVTIMETYLSNYGSNIIDYNFIKFGGTINAASRTLIPLTTYDGSGETIHPSVVDCGADWNGYRYWMANTPYPASNSYYENPSIWASADGITWEVPSGVTNPIVAPSASGYNADTFIYFESGKMYVFYKEVNNSVRTIKVTKSTDGVTWSTPVICLTTDADETECVSPSVVKVGSIYYMYYNKYLTTSTNEFKTRRASSTTIDGVYSNKEDIEFSPILNINIVWHVDVKYINGKYYIIGVLTTGSGTGTSIYIASSVDGKIFNVNVAPTYTSAIAYYRASLAIINGNAKMYVSNYISSKWGLEMFDVTLI